MLVRIFFGIKFHVVRPSVWISSANAAAVVEKNFRLVHGPSDFFYLVRAVVLSLITGSLRLCRTAVLANGSVTI